MAQFLRPASIIAANLWTGSHTAIDEPAPPVDSDFIYSPNNPNNTVEVGLSGATDPQQSTGHILRVRLTRGDADGTTPSSSGTGTTYGIALYQGATLIATAVATGTAAPTAWTTIEYTLSAAEADAITNYNDLRVQINASGGGGSTTNRRNVAVSWAELETPDALAVTTYTGSFIADAEIAAAPTTPTGSFTADAEISSSGGGTPTVYAADTFTRSVTGGLGTADTGGVYTLIGTAADFNVDGSVATINAAANIAQYVAELRDVSAADVDMVVRFKFGAAPAGGSIFLNTSVRTATAVLTEGLRTQVEVTATGILRLSIAQRDGGTNTVLATTVDLASREGVTADAWYRLRFQAEGSGTTTVRAKLWKETNAEPATWDREGTTTTASVQDAGWIAVRAAVASGVTNGPILWTLDDLNASSLSAGGSQVTGSFTADAIILATSTGTFIADAEIAAAQMDSPVWVSPPDDAATINTTTPTLNFTMPTTTSGDMHFEIQLDTANTFDTVNLQSHTSYNGSGWEYYNGTSWVAIPSTGVPSQYAGNAARFTVPSALAQGTWYRRVRGGV